MRNSTGVTFGGLDITFDYIVSLLAPKKVKLTSTQYADFAEMKADFERTGYLSINVEHSDNTIFGSAVGNWQFRAWHDACHILADADFSFEGESSAAAKMIEQLHKLDGPTCEDIARWSAIIDAEVNGQGLHYQLTGEFPKDQRAYVREYIARNHGLVDSDFPTTREQLQALTVAY